MAETYFCFACGHEHRAESAVGRDHRRYAIEGGHDRGGIFEDLREFYVQTKGIAAAFRILGFDEVRIHPPRYGRGWPSREAVERAFRERAKRLHPDQRGDPGEFRKIEWAVEVLRRYRPPES